MKRKVQRCDSLFDSIGYFDPSVEHFPFSYFHIDPHYEMVEVIAFSSRLIER